MATLVKKILTLALRLYQVGVSPWLGQRCRFYPSCSHYAIASLDKHATLPALQKIGRRLSRCHPWNPGGVDLP